MIKKLRIIVITIAFAAVTILSSCENNLEVINAITNPNIAPELSGTDVEIMYSDSAKLKVRIVTPELKKFRKLDNKPYIEFPKGMHVYFYDDSMKVNAEVSANYAIYREIEKLWEARSNVIIVNVKGEKLNTEQLFWDETKEIIYSDKYCKITSPEGDIHIGYKGLTARQDFSNVKLLGAKGTMRFMDEAE